jgi:hypothetical protein
MKLKHRISRLEMQCPPPEVYPIHAVFSEGGRVERIFMSDGARLEGQAAVEIYHRLPRPFPLKVYLFDPDVVWSPASAGIAREKRHVGMARRRRSRNRFLT